MKSCLQNYDKNEKATSIYKKLQKHDGRCAPVARDRNNMFTVVLKAFNPCRPTGLRLLIRARGKQLRDI
jgi:hypothetical protein